MNRNLVRQKKVFGSANEKIQNKFKKLSFGTKAQLNFLEDFVNIYIEIAVNTFGYSHDFNITMHSICHTIIFNYFNNLLNLIEYWIV